MKNPLKGGTSGNRKNGDKWKSGNLILAIFLIHLGLRSMYCLKVEELVEKWKVPYSLYMIKEERIE
ncbi:hypothetical protein KAR91_75790 [Candidatus Pacearchaeota archaeon]|nr:hypothetical protein [Candidatus Pacearchaeota archaeon]